jgi:hypothetical protein
MKGRLSLSDFVTDTADECKQYISPNSDMQDEGQEKEKRYGVKYLKNVSSISLKTYNMHCKTPLRKLSLLEIQYCLVPRQQSGDSW